ncbi:hypothetical protein [Bacillus smithii]|uniref:hypothetical protein n=1 Tax=Bacillus smithii TaxID=1479 RepID=UPI00077B9B5D|nr:hypothetical protein [Bacillus smithii]
MSNKLPKINTRELRAYLNSFRKLDHFDASLLIMAYESAIEIIEKQQLEIERLKTETNEKIKRYEKVLKIFAEHEDRYFWNGYHRNNLWMLAKKALEGTE